MAALIDMLHPGMVIAHVDADTGVFVTWNGSATFRVFRQFDDERTTEIDVFTRYEVKNIAEAVKVAGEWYAAQEGSLVNV